MADDKTIPASLLKISEAARYLNLSEVSVRRAIREGTLPYLRFGRAIRLALTDLDDFAAAHRIAAQGGDQR
ncbi:excisionase family DNA binding protein [Kibdelosporangium banguiense]|uniref:Excisionase family DNA binding protein n=1 Tax=Kibdelosporangium banguiense TaxID=1365924 RepID=A0ABS4THA8_9PSEU|nr:helix-turn-helix domain-containing protein [Kibdelosporangium banguiense]MBP2323779.1 excisionase family DNA binding protein [Kibdelosporangium banguiense]